MNCVRELKIRVDAISSSTDFIMALVVGGLLILGGLSVQARQEKAALTAATTTVQPAENAIILSPVVITAPAPVTDPKADKAWRKIERAEKDLGLPPIGIMLKLLVGKPDVADMRNMVGGFLIPDELKRADRARDFSAQFPNYPQVLAARIIEFQHLAGAYHMVNELTGIEAALKSGGHLADPQKFSFTNILSRMLVLEKECMGDTNLSDAQRFIFRSEQVNRLSHGPLDKFAEGARALEKEFPRKEGSADYLRMVMERVDTDQARALATEVIDGPAPDKLKINFKGFLHRLDSMGTNVIIRFAALDGRDVDTTKMKGKVVLVVFWATWCGPCVAEVPALKAAYGKFHAQGLEIIGISLDQKSDQRKLTKFLKAQKIPWPQYFDGKERDNDLAVRFGIDGVPTLFLIDKQGNLRETKARERLEQKITNLLAEP